MNLPILCGVNGCRKIAEHPGNHDAYPTAAWNFMSSRDKNKLSKAGFATPRGGEKGAYQNHVVRSNKVIVPFERVGNTELDQYEDGYVIRLYPEQYFERASTPKAEFDSSGIFGWIVVGVNAFVLYRTHLSFETFPPLHDWLLRRLERDGIEVVNRDAGIRDVGHYVLRMPRLGDRPKRFQGPPQGIFAPEYASEETNFLCKCVLAWIILHTVGSPYTTTQAAWLKLILASENLLTDDVYEYKGSLRRGLATCPLCLRFISYEDLHRMVAFEDIVGVENAAGQVEGATRSTVVNLFHIEPLTYDILTHIPANMAWGHAICNTRLGQRHCVSLAEIMEMNNKIGILREEGVETIGWISDDYQMIRSPNGAVWIQLQGDFPDLFDVPTERSEEDI